MFCFVYLFALGATRKPRVEEEERNRRRRSVGEGSDGDDGDDDDDDSDGGDGGDGGGDGDKTLISLKVTGDATPTCLPTEAPPQTTSPCIIITTEDTDHNSK